MRTVLVSSPGQGPGPHWSEATAAALAAELRRLGVEVTWLCASVSGAGPRSDGATVVPLPRRPAVARIARSLQHTALEVELQRCLRVHPTATVVHLGAGAAGSPNVGWLADGSADRSHGPRPCLTGNESEKARVHGVLTPAP